jgi:hypothetical protein
MRLDSPDDWRKRLNAGDEVQTADQDADQRHPMRNPRGPASNESEQVV